MILDTTDRLNNYRSALPGLDKAMFAHQKRGVELAEALRAQGYEVRDKSYDTREDNQRKFEEHFHTVDVMICLEGEEIIHVCPAQDLQAGESLPEGQDGRKLLGGPRGLPLRLKAGHFAAFFPGEAHMVAGHVGGQQGPVHKLVVKVDLSRDINPACPCDADCVRHGSCSECVVWHRQPNNSLPSCLREKGKLLIERALKNQG
ncbi:MAG: YhcH/YjgK/YiaL family protein [Bacillota bacterium]|nr:YhcH/YjgK/YiaL family protein [Bacillota bacterium]